MSKCLSKQSYLVKQGKKAEHALPQVRLQQRQRQGRRVRGHGRALPAVRGETVLVQGLGSVLGGSLEEGVELGQWEETELWKLLKQ